MLFAGSGGRMSARSSQAKPIGQSPRLAITQELLLAALVAVEVAVFGALGTNFFTGDNAMEIVRLSAELGLIALALTPVIVSGGIDLSVGSLMGLCAVIFGMLWRDARLPIPIAGAAALLLGGLAGLLNGGLI